MSILNATTSAQRGLFVVVEGLDRAGKSTQVARLAKLLDAKAIKFPDRTTAIGQMIDSYLASRSELDDRAIHLLFSANRWECAKEIQKTIDLGQNIVCDRYAFSGIAYSVAKGLPYDWALAPDRGLPSPDLTIFLDLDPKLASSRAGYGDERYERLELQQDVRQIFMRIAQEASIGGKWVSVEASQSLEVVGSSVERIAGELLGREEEPVPLPGLFTSGTPSSC